HDALPISGGGAAGQALGLGGAAAEAETGPYDPVAAGQAGQHGQRGEAAGGLVQRPAGGDQQVGAAAEGRDGAAEHGRLPQQPVVVVRLDEPERDLGVLLGPALGGQQQTAQRDPYRVGGGREAQHVRQLAAERIVDGAQAGDHGVGGAAPVEGGGLLGRQLPPVRQDAHVPDGQPGLLEGGGDGGGRQRVDGQPGHVLALVLGPYQGAEQRRARVVDERGRSGEHAGVAAEQVRHGAGEQPSLDGRGLRLHDGGGLRFAVVVQPQGADARPLLAGGRDLVDQVVRSDDTDDDRHPRLRLARHGLSPRRGRPPGGEAG